MIDIAMKANSVVRDDNDEEKQQNRRRPGKAGKTEAKMLSVERSPEHRRWMEVWRADLRNFETQKEDAMDERRRLREEVYQIVSMSLIFEGVVLTAAAQSTRLTCSMWWSPIGLALSVAAAACAAVLRKYRAIHQTELDQDVADHNIKAIIKSLDLLDQEGAALDLDKAQPQSSYKFQNSAPVRIRFVAKRATLTLALLVIFSLTVSLFSKFTLCNQRNPCADPHHRHHRRRHHHHHHHHACPSLPPTGT